MPIRKTNYGRGGRARGPSPARTYGQVQADGPAKAFGPPDKPLPTSRPRKCVPRGEGAAERKAVGGE
jgi:hypothetical protein